MCRLRLRAQDDLGTSGCNEGFQIGDLMIFNLFDVFFGHFLGQIWSDLLGGLGIQVVVEVGLGLGVFAGDALGIGNSVRQLSARATQCG